MSEMLTMTRALLGDYERNAAIGERDRFIALLDNELDQCTCEDPLRHLRERVLMIAVKGERENTERTLSADDFRTTTGQEAHSQPSKGEGENK